MLLSFVRVDGSALGDFDGPVRQVIAVESRVGRMPIGFAQIDEVALSGDGHATVLSWLCADGEVEAVDVTGDANLVEGLRDAGVVFAQFGRGGGFERETQIIQHCDGDERSRVEMDSPGG